MRKPTKRQVGRNLSPAEALAKIGEYLDRAETDLPIFAAERIDADLHTELTNVLMAIQEARFSLQRVLAQKATNTDTV